MRRHRVAGKITKKYELKSNKVKKNCKKTQNLFVLYMNGHINDRIDCKIYLEFIS